MSAPRWTLDVGHALCLDGFAQAKLTGLVANLPVDELAERIVRLLNHDEETKPYRQTDKMDAIVHGLCQTCLGSGQDVVPYEGYTVCPDCAGTGKAKP